MRKRIVLPALLISFSALMQHATADGPYIQYGYPSHPVGTLAHYPTPGIYPTTQVMTHSFAYPAPHQMTHQRTYSAGPQFNGNRQQMRQGMMRVGAGIATSVLRHRLQQSSPGFSPVPMTRPPTYAHQMGEMVGQLIIQNGQRQRPPVAPTTRYETRQHPGTNLTYTVAIPGS